MLGFLKQNCLPDFYLIMKNSAKAKSTTFINIVNNRSGNFCTILVPKYDAAMPIKPIALPIKITSLVIKPFKEKTANLGMFNAPIAKANVPMNAILCNP